MPDRTVIALDSFEAVAGPNEATDLEMIEGGFIEGSVLDADGLPLSTTPKGRAIGIGVHGPAQPRSGAAILGIAV